MVIELLEQDPRDKFVDFLKSFRTPDGEYKYRKRLSQMAITGQRSLIIDFEDLMQFNHELANQLIEKPTKYIEAASLAVGDVMRIVNLSYAMKIKRFKARFRKLPELTPLRRIRAEHLGKLIMIEGILTRASSVKQQLVRGVFECQRCGATTVIESRSEDERISQPDRCSNPACRSKGPFKLIIEESEFIDWQRLTIQEKPEELPPGQLPRSIDAIAREDVVDIARPGDRVVVVGILKPRPERMLRGKTIMFKPILEINSIDVSEKGLEEIEITPEDEERIRELAKDPFIHRKIVQSIAPSIYGYNEIKEGIAYLLFGGVPKQLPDGVRIRGEINILLVGDPGTAKSQLLQYVARIAPRGIYTSGKGSTAAGLTAAVVRDKVTGDWYLEAGALVLADGGVACIDEIDKMRNEDRVAIHEAMEQQSYHKDFEILLADGRKVRIGEFIDKIMEENRNKIVKGKDTEILFVDNIYVMAYDLNEKKIKIVKADRISRHKAPSKFIKITFSNGRSITVTPEHPIVIWNKNGFTTIRADQVKLGMIVPGVNYYEIISENNEISEQLGELIDCDYESLARFTGFILSDGFTYRNSSNGYYEIEFSNKNEKLIDEFKSLLESMNIKYEEQIALKNRKNTLYTVRTISKRLYQSLREYFPELFIKQIDKKARSSRLKRIPSIIFKMPIEIKAKFINTLFKGDGFIDNYRIGFRTSSIKLAEDLQDLLLSMGIHSYISSEKTKEGREYYKVIISGTNSLTKFREIIIDDNRIDRIDKLIERSMRRLNYRNQLPVEIANELRKIANELDINDGYLTGIVRRGNSLHVEKARIYFELAKERISELKNALNSGDTNILRKFVKLTTLSMKLKMPYSTLRYRLLKKKDQKIARVLIEEASKKLKLIEEKLSNLKNYIYGNIRFLSIKNIEVIDNNDSEWVYDITVEPHHLFISHGLVLHNTISIAKAGIVATLNARTAILAAANPVFGRYVDQKTLAENINLPVTILSRFDLIFPIRDVPEETADEKLSEHILKIHQVRGYVGVPPIPPDLLKKYISYARKYVSPRLTPEAAERIKEFYLEMRREGMKAESIPITPRQLEALIRMAEARAKMALRDEVTVEDAEAAIRLMSYVLKLTAYDKETQMIDIDSIMTGKPASQRTKMMILMDIIKSKVKEIGGAVKIEEVIETAKEEGLDKKFVESCIERMLREGLLYEQRPGYIMPT